VKTEQITTGATNERGLPDNSWAVAWAEPAHDAASGIHRRLRQAAAVLAEFDFETIRPVGEVPVDPADEAVARQRLRAGADSVRYASGKPRLTLRDAERRQTLQELGTREAMREALRWNRAPDIPLQRALERLIEGQDVNPPGLSTDELAATLAAAGWLVGILPGIPDRINLERSLARQDIMERIERLAENTDFVGRENELRKLRERLDEARDASPILVHGPGGIGKSTLVAHALWPEVQAGAVVVWLDFDRTILDPRRPITVFSEAARQLASLVPEAADGLLRLREQSSRWIREAASEAAPGIGMLADRFGGELSRLLLRLRVVIVLDTFEEVQLFGSETEAELAELLRRLQRTMSGLSILICGRVAATAEGLEALPLPDLNLADSVRLLRLLVKMELGEDAEAALAELAKELGGNPLVLRLAARVISAEGAGALLSPAGRDAVRTAIRAERLQGMLYGRILNHLRSDSARRVAFPGLVVRLITPAVIREVLAGPCRIDLSRTPAETIYAELESEVALVAPDPVGSGLRHRPDVRRLMLAEIVDFVSSDDVAAIDRASVEYWTSQEGPVARAEEIYHRLRLGQDREILDSRWDESAAPFLDDALQELSPTQRLWLADRLGATVEPSLRQEADQQGWEAQAARAAKRRLRSGDGPGALAILQERRDRSPASPVHLVEMQALWTVRHYDEASSIANREAPRALAAGRTSCAVQLWLTAALMDESKGDLATALEQAEAAAAASVNLTDTSTKLRVLTTRIRLLRKLGEGTEAELRELRREAKVLVQPEILQKVHLDPATLRQIVAELGDDDAELLKFGIANLGLDPRSALERRRLAQALAELEISRMSSANDKSEEVFSAGRRSSTLEQWLVTHSGEALATYVGELLEQAPIDTKVVRAFAQFFRTTVDTNIGQAWEDSSEALVKSEPNRSPTDSNLANAYRERVRRNRANTVEQAIEHYGRALETLTREALPFDWALTQANIANAYRERIRGERADNIERAIAHYHQAFEVLTRAAFPFDWALTQANIANAYRERIRGERADNIERAIAHYHQAFEVLTRAAFPFDWALTQANIANAYRERIRGKRADNIERAIAHCHQAFEVLTRAAFPFDWALTQANIANAYRERIRGERADNIERAIAHYEAGVQVLTREDFPMEWALAQSNLGNAHRARIRGDHADNIEQAIAHYHQAFEVLTRDAFPFDWALTQANIANVYRERLRGQRADNVNRAIAHYEAGGQVLTRDAFPAECRRTMALLGHIFFDREDWVSAHRAFMEAIEAGQDLFAQAYTEFGRRAEAGENARLYAADAYCLLRLGQPGAALLTLERGKTLLLNGVLALNEQILAALPAPDLAALSAVRQAIREVEAEMRLPLFTAGRRDDHELSAVLHEVRAKLNKLIETIRAVRPDFMPTSLDLPELLDLIPDGGALVFPLFTAKGGAAIVLPHGATAVIAEHVVWLNEFADADVLALVQGPQQPPGLGGLVRTNVFGSDRPAWLYALETTGRILWDRLIGPVHERLVAYGFTGGAPVLLIPQGVLGLLPLHAAWREMNGQRRYFLDDYTVSYAPSGYTVTQLRRRLNEAARQQPRRSLLSIVDPTSELPFARAEGEAIAALFADSEVLVGDMATLGAVLAAAPKHSHLHFACDGSYDASDPVGSGLILARNQRLTLAEIVRLELPTARLVVLSSCNSALSDIRRWPDEWDSFPAGFLQAGSPGVIATLWAVDDLSTMLLVERFYQEHILRSLAPAAALREAQLWLRNATGRELNLASQLFEVHPTIKSAKIRSQVFASARYFMNHADERPFAHPHHWAAFTLIGA
jgi:CHAT domain-containing protein/tetratricopeptide (TPR) repeat protein